MVKLLQENQKKINELIDKVEKLCSTVENFNKKISANEVFISKFIERHVLTAKV